MPALIIEDGTIVPNANSYATLVQIRDYVAARGVSLPVEDETVSQYAIRAMDYLSTFSEKYKGSRTDATQVLDWPRTGVYINDVLLAPDYMPLQLVYAQAAAVAEISKGNDLMPLRSGAQVRSERLGPMAVEYFAPPSLTATIPVIDSILALLLENTASLRVRRV